MFAFLMCVYVCSLMFVHFAEVEVTSTSRFITYPILDFFFVDSQTFLTLVLCYLPFVLVRMLQRSITLAKKLTKQSRVCGNMNKF